MAYLRHLQLFSWEFRYLERLVVVVVVRTVSIYRINLAEVFFAIFKVFDDIHTRDFFLQKKCIVHINLAIFFLYKFVTAEQASKQERGEQVHVLNA